MNRILLSFLVLFAVACQTDKFSKETKQLQHYFSANFTDIVLTRETGLKVLLIPSIGCSPCIKKGWDFYHENKVTDIIFITNDQYPKDEKREGLYFEKEDAQLKMNDLFFLDIYPLLIRLDEAGRIESLFHLSPGEEDVFQHELQSGI